MSLLDDAGGFAEKAADKATNNPLGSALDAIAGGLSGSAGAGPAGIARFIDGGPIEIAKKPRTFPAPPDNPGANTPAKSSTPLNMDKPPQFLHLAYAHDDVGTLFPGGVTSHGIAFRDALVREAVLLHSFAQGGKRVLAKNKESKGAAGALLGAASSLLGGAKQAAPGPEAFDPLFTQIRSATDPINQESFDYPVIHAAGLALAKTADAHNELCKNAMVPDGGGGLGLPSIPGLDSVLAGAGVPAIVAKIPAWLFKVQDAYLAMYREARIAYEWPLMKLCHDYSLDAVRGKWQPTFDIWRQRNAEATEAAQATDDPSQVDDLSKVELALKAAQDKLEEDVITLGGSGYGATDTGPGKDARDKLVDAQNAVKDLRTSGEDKAQMLAGLLQTAADLQSKMPPEAVATLAKAFALFAGDAANGVKSFGERMNDALGKALIDGDLPDFMKFYTGKLAEATLTVLDKVYRAIHGVGGTPDPSLVLAAVNDAIASKIVGLIFSLILGRDPAANDSSDKQKTAKSVVDDVGTGSFGSALGKAKSLSDNIDQEAENKAAELVTAFLRNQGQHLDGIIFFVAQELCLELGDAYLESYGKNALTMEAYLGRLPMLAATVMRNLLFPIFNLVMDVFGMGDKFAGQVWNPVSEGIGKVTDVATSVKDTKDDIHDSGKDIKEGLGRADDEIDDRKRKANEQIGRLSDVNQDDAVDGFSKQSGAFDDLKNNVTGAPGAIKDAAMNDGQQDPAVEAVKKDPNRGPLTAQRVAEGKALPITNSQIVSAGREVPVDEKIILNARIGPSTAPAAPAGPKMPSLSDIGKMF
ncbi:MAG: hypothetical protein JWQ90_4770 [Hydrocarboniphaga sp.]|uniref:hypothetical protein n=1 Tax=Hydrocarboniphaga sp. TaxID=2033016 RepID=UPI002638E4F3|nr:hypothetical protein [Hydrocarboniphaga sp.]MDB5972320.1 hypothetical protein [Hydrocarboniphaga sp.]